MSDPFVISCWSIVVPANGMGINIASAAADKAFVIRDIQIEAGPDTSGSAMDGIQIGGPSAGAAEVEHTTESNLNVGASYGITTSLVGALQLVDNQLTNDQIGINVNGGHAVVEGNVGTGDLGTCIEVSGPSQVTNNSCTDGSGTGFNLASSGDPVAGVNDLVAAGNVADNNSGIGFNLSNGGVAARANTSNGNNYGFALLNSNVVEGNTIDGNRADGIDTSGAVHAIIDDNTIEHNAGVGIQADAANANYFFERSSQIVGNRIGFNPYGIILFGQATANQVSQTYWTDGQQSIADLGDQNTIVDAGSSKRAGIGQPVLFYDSMARVAIGRGAEPPSPPSVPGVTVGGAPGQTDLSPQLTVETGISWNFGDGSAPVSVTPSQGVGPVPQLSHTYSKAGTYTAALTVTGAGLNASGQTVPVSLSDTVQVDISSPVHGAAQPTCGQYASVSAADWASLGNGSARTFCTRGSNINASNVDQLVPQWRFPTNAEVTASPAVATVGGTEMVYDGDYDGMLYALNSGTGLPVWGDCLVQNAPAPAPICSPPYPTNSANQVDYGVIVASPSVATVGGIERVFEAATDHMWSLDAATGKVVWTFDAAGNSGVNNYEIESSPLVVNSPSTGEQLVVFSVDCNGYCAKPGGVYAVDAADGHLVWFFDPVSGANYQPTATNITGFGPTQFGPTSAGDGACGGVWTSQSADMRLGVLFTSSADCPQQPMSTPYYEAAFALNLGTGAPVWHYQPRTRDSQDLDFGATPNVLRIETTHGEKDVVGFGSKDGTYTLFDAKTGAVLWSDKLTVGGNFGGFYNGATDGTNIYLTSAIGTLSATTVSAADDASKGREWAIDAATGAILWVQDIGSPTLGQNAVAPGVYFASGLDHVIHAYSTVDGSPLAVLPLGGADSSGPAVVGDQVFSGAGTGASWRSAVGTCLDPVNAFGECQSASAVLTAPVPIPVGEYGQGIWAFCLASQPACQTSRVTFGRLAPPGL